MRSVRRLTNKEWKEISEKYKDGGVHMYRGKRTFFYNGEMLWVENEDIEEGWPLIYGHEERDTWQVLIVLPGVEVIPEFTFKHCKNVETVIMSDTVRRIEDHAFYGCHSLTFVKLSKNLECIGKEAFDWCCSLTSIFIPPSCREIGEKAFRDCGKLIIFSFPQNVELGDSVILFTALLAASPFHHRSNQAEFNEWIKTLNDGQDFALHRECASTSPSFDRIYETIKAQGLKALYRKNSLGITALDYLSANPYADVNQQAIAKKYVLEMMGEVV